jgi:hypothetical protein
MRALVSLARSEEAPAGGDPAIRQLIVAAFAESIAELWGTITDERERQACIVTAENVAGVRPCMITWSGSSRYPAWRFRRPRMKPRYGPCRRRLST